MLSALEAVKYSMVVGNALPLVFQQQGRECPDCLTAGCYAASAGHRAQALCEVHDDDLVEHQVCNAVADRAESSRDTCQTVSILLIVALVVACMMLLGTTTHRFHLKCCR